MKPLAAALCASSLAIAWAGGARSADLDWRPPATGHAAEAADAPAYNWQGLYGGGFLGLATHDWTADFARNANHGTAEIASTGLAFGAWIGYAMAVSRNVVVGIEADLGHAGTSQSNTIFDNDTSLAAIGTFASLRGRVGVAVDRFLVYATAGVATADITNEIQKGQNAGEEIVANGWQTGFTLGGGIEYALSRNWSARAEYLYAGFGTQEVRNRDGNLAELTNEMHLVRAGLSYRF